MLEAGNAVTLTTMHSSKGLEWPLVVVADLNWSPPPGTDAVLIDAGYGVALRGGEEEGQPLVYTLIADRQAAQDAQEARRLLYVAATRARDGLLLSGSGPAGKGSLLELLLPGLQAAGLEVRELTPLERDFELPELPELPLPPEPSAIWADPLPGTWQPRRSSRLSQPDRPTLPPVGMRSATCSIRPGGPGPRPSRRPGCRPPTTFTSTCRSTAGSAATAP